MWRLQYLKYSLLVNLAKITKPFSKRLSRHLWTKGYLLITPKNPTAQEQREGRIAYFRKRILERLDENLSKLERDESFQDFITDYLVPAHGKAITIEDLREFNRMMASEYAELLFTLSHVCGVQYVPCDEDTGGKCFGLRLVTESSNKVKDDDDNVMSLELLSDDVSDTKKYRQNIFNFLSFLKMKHIVHPRVSAYLFGNHITRELLTKIYKNSDEEDATDKLIDNLGVFCNIAENQIARDTRRGAGNVIIVDSLMASRFKDIISVDQDVDDTRRDYFEIPENDGYNFLKYEFSINNMVKVFSSNVLSEVTGDENKIIVLYNGATKFDAGYFIYLEELFGIIEDDEITEEFLDKQFDDLCDYGTNETINSFKVKEDIKAGKMPKAFAMENRYSIETFGDDSAKGYARIIDIGKMKTEKSE